MTDILRAVKGMNDILPPESARWEWFEDKVRALMQRYAYRNVRTPIVEPTALFVRGLGEVTDIVEKEMYSFADAMNGDRLTLRPEATAGIVRAMIEHNALYNGPLRLWSEVTLFRHERPQKGRYRQFHQIDVEALGHAGPDVDAEQILMCRALWRDLGLVEGRDVRLELNSLGQPDERHAHRAALIAHFEQHADALDEDARRRLHSNPLRILDSKNPAMQGVVEAAPRLMDFLGEASLAHFAAVRGALDAAGLEYRVSPRMVRGLDYYNLTVFEWVTDHLGSQGTVCGGGRYDGLFAQLGGKPTPAIGWGMGVERMLLLLEAIGVPMPAPTVDVYAVVPGSKALPVALATCEALRAAGLSVQMHAAGAEGWGSMKAQFRRADASGAGYALVFGDDELARGEVALK
ncbi:MAG: histidine--tRNA ligase, partial [Rhizobacter sp.]|nr:histidine--tRNA ligase [Rhizobacter sp.]